jgi:hypothetical protein
MQPTRTLLVTLAAGGLLTAAAITAGAITANGASAVGGRAAAATPSPTATSPAPNGQTPNGQTPNGPAPNGPGPRVGRGRAPDGRGAFGGFGGLRGLLGGPVLHGEFVTGGQNGSATTVVVQSGTVTAKSGSSITVQSTDKYTVTWTLDSNTTVRTRWVQGAVKDIAVGDLVRIKGTRSGSTTTARFVGDRPKNAPQNGPRGSGSTPIPSATTTS